MSDGRIALIVSAIDYMEAHLTEKLNLETVSTAVHYSKYHLHRVFTSTVGLTIHDYLQRRKLTEAAKLLVLSGKPILDIALLAGYESQQAFTDIFTAMYKQPPSKFRENKRFYPLQLKFEFGGTPAIPAGKETHWQISFAAEDDIPCWMELVRLVIDGFPHLDEGEYKAVLKQRIRTRQALLLRDGPVLAGVMLFSYQTGSIDFMGTHPLYRRKGVPKAMLDKVTRELIRDKTISITTYRKGDKADTGHRKEIQTLGFAEAENLIEYGYPTQRFILPQDRPRPCSPCARPISNT